MANDTIITTMSSTITSVITSSANSTLPSPTSGANMPLFIACYVLAGLLFLPGVFGNGMIIIVIMKNRKLRTPTNYLIASLAVADILMMIIMVAWLSYILTPADKLLIHAGVKKYLFASLDLLVGSASIINLAAVSLDRGMAVVRPLHYQSMVNHRRTRRSIIFIWVYAVAAFTASILRSVIHSKSYKRSVLYLAYVCGFAIPFLVILSSYTVILLSAVKSIKITRALEKAMISAANHGARNRTEEALTRRRMRMREIKIGGNIMVILIPFVVGWGFYFGTMLYEEMDENFARTDLHEWLITVIPWFNSSINPIIYIFLTRSLRKGCRRLLCKRNPYGRPRENSFMSRTFLSNLNSKRASFFERANSSTVDKSPTLGRYSRRRSSDGLKSISFSAGKESTANEIELMTKPDSEITKPLSTFAMEVKVMYPVAENHEDGSNADVSNHSITLV